MTAERDTYEMLLACYLSEQMSEAQLEAHMREDEVFRAWAARKLEERKSWRSA